MKTNNLFYKIISIGSVIFGILFLLFNLFKSFSDGIGICSSYYTDTLNNNLIFSLIIIIFGIISLFIKRSKIQAIFIFLFFVIIIVYIFRFIYIRNIDSIKDKNCMQNLPAVKLPI